VACMLPHPPHDLTRQEITRRDAQQPWAPYFYFILVFLLPYIPAACFPLVAVAISGGVAAPTKRDRRLSHVLSHSDVLCMHTMRHAQTTRHTCMRTHNWSTSWLNIWCLKYLVKNCMLKYWKIFLHLRLSINIDIYFFCFISWSK
jgi:hypothetical protein